MNDFRLSSNATGQALRSLTDQQAIREELKVAIRAGYCCAASFDQNESSVYLIIKPYPNHEELIVKSLKEAAGVVGVHYSTLSKQLLAQDDEAVMIEVNNYSVRRVKVFS